MHQVNYLQNYDLPVGATTEIVFDRLCGAELRTVDQAYNRERITVCPCVADEGVDYCTDCVGYSEKLLVETLVGVLF